MAEEKNKKTKPRTLIIELHKEVLREKDGTVSTSKDPKGKEQKRYKQDDALALMLLLKFYDSRKSAYKDYKHYLNLKDKVELAWRKNLKKLDLSLDQATFLKDYLEEFNEKTAPLKTLTPMGPVEIEENRINEFTMRTFVAILDQLA